MRRSKTNPAPLLLALFGALAPACSSPDVNINKLEPDIAVGTDLLDFGDVVVLYSAAETISLVNAGRAPLEITNIAVEGDDDGVFVVTPTSGTLEEDENLGVEIAFAPDNYLEYARDLIIYSNDPENPEYRLAITGEGVDGPVPDISLDTQSIDFGTVPVGEPDDQWFTITNVGDGDLIIEEVIQTGSGAFSMNASLNGMTLAELGFSTTIVNYAPTQDGGDSGQLLIKTNDPDEPEVQVILLGNGGGDFDYPEALIDCPPIVNPPLTVDLDGSGSFDPDGNTPLTYQWTLLESPEGTTADFHDDQQSATTLPVDMAGIWSVQLKVANSLGVQSAPAVCDMAATPQNSIHVEVVWNSNNSDVDLHLIQAGSNAFELPGDCTWCNPNPNWGGSGESDDPNLALDNQLGFGPENIHLESPAEGDYDVRVHYFEDLGGGTTTVTARIWLNGELADEVSQNLTHNQIWTAGTIRWPEAVFAAADDTPTTSSKRDCY